MLVSKADVDYQAKTILEISKNLDDKDIQCKNISQLYYNIKEFAIAKNYVERYLSAKSNSESALFLKANIHKELKEYNLALQCYKMLYYISNNNDYIVKACDCLMSSDIDEENAKIWIDWVQGINPDYEKLVPLKTRFWSDFEALSEELMKLEEKMKKDFDNQFKRQYFAILQRAPISNDVLSKCINIMKEYDVLDDLEIIQYCVTIFKKHSFPTFPFFKEIYCVLLLGLINGHYKYSLGDCSDYLLELKDLLTVVDNDTLYLKLKNQFLYHMVAFAHFSAVFNNKMTGELSDSFFKLYRCLVNTDTKFVNGDVLPEKIYNWLHQQSCYQCSILNHIVYFDEEEVEIKTQIHINVVLLCNIVWPSKVSYYADIERMFEEQAQHMKTDKGRLIELDIRCHAPRFVDFTFIICQFLSHLNWFQDTSSDVFQMSPSAASFICLLLDSMFSRFSHNNLLSDNHYHESVSKVDLLTFLLGAAVTCRKPNLKNHNRLPLPFGCLNTILAIDNSHVVWWRTVCYFILNNKPNTPGGMNMEILKRGLELVRAVDCPLSEVTKLHIGRFLETFASNSDWEKAAVLKRSNLFFQSAIESFEARNAGCYAPKMSYSKKRSSSNRKNKNHSNNDTQYAIFFDTVPVSDEIIDVWRFEAFISCIDANLNWLDDPTEAEALLTCAEKMQPNDPYLSLCRSKLYLRLATDPHDRDEEHYNRYSTLALRHANRCREAINSTNNCDQDKIRALLNTQYLAIDASEYEYLFQRGTESNNNNVNINIEEQSIPTSESVYDKTFQRLNYCVKKCEDVITCSRKDQNNIGLLKVKIERQDDLYSNMIMKLEQLTRDVDKFSIIEDDFDRLETEQRVLKCQYEGLENTVSELKLLSSSLELKIQGFEESMTLSSNYRDVDKVLSSELIGIRNVVQGHCRGFDEIECRIIEEFISTRRDKCRRCRSKNPIVLPNLNEIFTQTSETFEELRSNVVGYEETIDSDSDVIIIDKPMVTDEQIQRARALQLPDHFYYFENLPDQFGDEKTAGKSTESIKEIKIEEISDSLEIDVSFDLSSSDVRVDETKNLSFSPRDNVMIDEDGWKLVYGSDCKLFRYGGNDWSECGSGFMAIQSRLGLEVRLLMRRIPGMTVCYQRSVTKNGPMLRPMNSSVTTVCWVDCRPGDDLSMQRNGNMALRFKTEVEKTEFTRWVCSFQCKMRGKWN